MYVLDIPFDEHWEGKGGTISLIQKDLQMSILQSRKILWMLQETMKCLREGDDFDGRIKSNNQVGQKFTIKSGSGEEFLIVN